MLIILSVPMHYTLFLPHASTAWTRALLIEWVMSVWKFVTEKSEKLHMRINERKKRGQGSGKVTSQGS